MILFIDDEPHHMQSYREALELEGYKSTMAGGVKEGMEILVNSTAEIELVVLDIMMPPEILGEEETERGLRTGVVFFPKIREILPDIPVIILTNVSDPKIIKSFEQEPNTAFFQKMDLTPIRLVEVIRDMIPLASEVRRDTQEEPQGQEEDVSEYTFSTEGVDLGFKMLIDLGNATAEDLGNLYQAFSDLHRAFGGVGLVFRDDHFEVSSVEDQMT